jgi:ribosomal protein S18 acetylase RimI-like enzyme
MIIRRAENDDLDALCRLYVAFHEFHVRELPNRLASLGEPHTFDCTGLSHKLANLLTQPDAALFVAEANQHIVGLAEVYLRQDAGDSPRKPYRHGHVQSLMVDASVRGQGIGTALVRATEQWARENGACEMRLETWEFAAGPLRFYEDVGYHTLRRTLVRSLQL